MHQKQELSKCSDHYPSKWENICTSTVGYWWAIVAAKLMPDHYKIQQNEWSASGSKTPNINLSWEEIFGGLGNAFLVARQRIRPCTTGHFPLAEEN